MPFYPQDMAFERPFCVYRVCRFVALNFPSNQFGAQESGSEAEIGAFCEKNFGISFSFLANIEVNGFQAHPLYRFLKKSGAAFSA
jgi:glutathione peroxidase